MAGLRQTRTLFSTLTTTLSKLHVSRTPVVTTVPTISVFQPSRVGKYTVGIHTSTNLHNLSEFFDDKKNWGEQEVKVGRSWKKDELRIKSNDDLHKLWFVLLKERNMLLTMEHDAKQEYRLFPNPERIDKVEDSMKNLEDVVVERNRAYWMLETGETGERPTGVITDELGIRRRRRFCQYFIPSWMHHQKKETVHRGAAICKFQRLMREKNFLTKRRYYRRVRGHVYMLWRRFPNMNVEALQRQYPEVDVRLLQKHKKARGHHLQNEA
ncbi:hypothetical protein Pmani_034316 [Petrolisthes manimaculis]|uniref:Large ribosomal subunit protein uL29m n=1 Tax=Petrolisthes manimaculis TaxID=1843537 RepID=A0AAE1TPJ0_9EUCA|nr:hypothetical protein Pmani_034316 [Petrolisthes manimaculis]